MTTSSGTCLAVRHRSGAALFQEWCHHDSLPQGPRKTLSGPSIQPQKSRRQARGVPPRLEEADSVADEDLLPVEHVDSRRPEVTPCVAHARGVCVLDLVSWLFVCCGEKADPIGNELATLVADVRSFSRNGGKVLSSLDDRFWSALGHPGMEKFRDQQRSVIVWPVDFSRKACLKPEMYHVWKGAPTCTSQKCLRPASR